MRARLSGASGAASNATSGSGSADPHGAAPAVSGPFTDTLATDKHSVGPENMMAHLHASTSARHDTMHAARGSLLVIDCDHMTMHATSSVRYVLAGL